ncbi:MAG: adenosylhomocysteinase [Gammaproteobacteria bacterium]|nr:adenosylhomocysteinase [Gammaproteobacteria bacterium]MDH3766932.1 adenosylhomocysteinase [Gammaproteobacteria bacterium]
MSEQTPNIVASPERAAEGQSKIEWVRRNMPILQGLEKEFSKQKPFAGKRVLVCVHLEAKTANLATVFAAGGATVAVTGSNPDSTKDDVVAALDAAGLLVYARHGATVEEMRRYMNMALDLRPHIVIDDGGDIVELLHGPRAELLPELIGVCEETTTGVQRAKALAAAGKLRLPVVLVNEARCKYLFDNMHGTGQSVWDAVMRTTNLVIAGKTVVIVGFGWCGRGCALRAQGLGAQVIICEIDPVKAADASMMGYQAMPLTTACRKADIVITATGITGTLRQKHFEAMSDGALIANAGHFQDEIDVIALKTLAVRDEQVREKLCGYQLPSGAWVYLLGDGNIVNIACGDGHPAEVMDTSFSLQALCARFLVGETRMAPAVYAVPDHIDRRVAELKLASTGIEID